MIWNRSTQYDTSDITLDEPAVSASAQSTPRSIRGVEVIGSLADEQAMCDVRAHFHINALSEDELTPHQYSWFLDRASMWSSAWGSAGAADAQYQDEVLDRLSAIEQGVNRPTAVEQAVSFANRHPFLTGLFGSALVSRFLSR